MDTEKVSMITSGSFGQHIVTRMHNMPQVDSILIFSSDQEWHEQNAILISIMGTGDGAKKESGST